MGEVKTSKMDVTTITRLLLFAAYGAAALFAGRQWRHPEHVSVASPLFAFGAFVAGTWSLWYLYLAIANPLPHPWAGHVNRFLHLLIIAYVVAATIVVRVVREVRATGKPVTSPWLVGR